MPRDDRSPRTARTDDRTAGQGRTTAGSPASRALPTLPTSYVAPTQRNWGDLTYRLQIELERRRRETR